MIWSTPLLKYRETEGIKVRAIGYDLSQVKLEAVAFSLGIDKSVSSMTQAEKAQLRYYAIMTQVTEVQGDMARTLDSPANQMRIFSAAVTQAGRALGNIFIPLMSKVLPYATAVANVIRDIIDALFDIPEVDWGSSASSTGQIAENMENTEESAKKARDYLMGFDELNVISPNSGDTGAENESDWDFKLPEYDFIGETIKTTVSEIEEKLRNILGIGDDIGSWADELKTKFDEIKVLAIAVGGAILAWKVSQEITTAVSSLSTLTNLLSSSGIINGVGSFSTALSCVGKFAPEIAGVSAVVSVLAAALVQDAVPAVDLFAGANDNAFNESRLKIETFMNDIRGVSDYLYEERIFGGIITQEDVDTITGRINSVAETIKAELSNDRIESFNIFGSLRESLGDETLIEVRGSVLEYYYDLNQTISDNEERITEIFEQAKDEQREIKQSEWDEINSIVDEMTAIGVSHLSDSEYESMVILENLKNASERITLEQAESVIANAQETRDKTISAAHEQFTKQVTEAMKLRDAGAISEEVYQSIVDSAISTRDETISSANEMYDSIVSKTEDSLGDVAYKFDFETGNIKTNWDLFCEGTKREFRETWSVITSTFSDVWNNMKKTINSMIGGFELFVNSIILGVNGMISALNSLSFDVPDWVPGIGGEKFGFNIRYLNEVSFNRLSTYATGGFPDEGQVFVAREAGAEMVGSIGGKTAVANNDQIVEAVSAGVYQAVVSAMKQSGGSGIPVLNVYLDGKQISASVRQANKERGASIMGDQVYAY